MATKTVNLKDFAGELGRFAESHTEKFRQGVASGLSRSIPVVVQDSPIDTGQYAASWDFTVEEKQAIFGNFAPHAPIIERGARPFTPPIGPLLHWAKRVLQDPSQPPDFSPKVWRLAKGTQNKIARVGMVPKHVMERNIPKIISNIREELDRSFG